MKTRSAKSKGTRLEKDIARRINEVLGSYGVQARRMPMSGAIEGFKSDIYINLPIAIEAKNQEKVKLWEWWKQTEEQCPNAKLPALVISRNYNKDPIAIIRFEDLLFFMELAVQSGWVSSIRKGKKIIRKKTYNENS